MKNQALIIILKVLSVLNLIAGGIAGVYLLAHSKIRPLGYNALEQTNPVMIVGGAAALVEAIVGFVVLYALATILKEVSWLSYKAKNNE